MTDKVLIVDNGNFALTAAKYLGKSPMAVVKDAVDADLIATDYDLTSLIGPVGSNIVAALSPDLTTDGTVDAFKDPGPEWVCPSCGYKGATGEKCRNCGEKKPK